MEQNPSRAKNSKFELKFRALFQKIAHNLLIWKIVYRRTLR